MPPPACKKKKKEKKRMRRMGFEPMRHYSCRTRDDLLNHSGHRRNYIFLVNYEFFIYQYF